MTTYVLISTTCSMPSAPVSMTRFPAQSPRQSQSVHPMKSSQLISTMFGNWQSPSTPRKRREAPMSFMKMCIIAPRQLYKAGGQWALLLVGRTLQHTQNSTRAVCRGSGTRRRNRAPHVAPLESPDPPSPRRERFDGPSSCTLTYEFRSCQSSSPTPTTVQSYGTYCSGRSPLSSTPEFSLPGPANKCFSTRQMLLCPERAQFSHTAPVTRVDGG